MIYYINPGRSFRPPDPRRILQERCWKVTGSCRKTREKTGTWKQYSRPEFSGFFPMISGRILPESTGSCRNPPKKIRKIPGRNTASNFLVFSGASRPFPARTSFTWEFFFTFHLINNIKHFDHNFLTIHNIISNYLLNDWYIIFHHK